jgi:hypothetical protein
MSHGLSYPDLSRLSLLGPFRAPVAALFTREQCTTGVRLGTERIWLLFLAVLVNGTSLSVELG